MEESIPVFTEQQLIMSFEFGVTLSECAKDLNVELTRDIVERMEEIVKKELKERTLGKIALDFPALILAAFEPSAEEVKVEETTKNNE